MTLCLFLSQVLDPDHSCRAAVARLIVWLAINGRKPCAAGDRHLLRRAPATAAGGRRSPGPSDRPGGRGARADAWLWKGRRVTLVDGTTASMPDTPENQAAFPQMKSQELGLGFPLVRMVAMIALATGVVRDLAMGPYQGKETGETALFRDLLGRPRARARSCWGTAISPRSSGSRGCRERGVDGCSGCTSGGSTTSAGGGGSASRTTS